MNCRRRGKPSKGSKQVEKDPSRGGTGVQKGNGKKGMEYRQQTPPKPDKSGHTVDWSK